MGKVHMLASRAGKVRFQTLKVLKTDKPKTPKGRAGMRCKISHRNHMDELRLEREKELDVIARSSGPWRRLPRETNKKTNNKNTQFGELVTTSIHNSFPMVELDEEPTIQIDKELLMRMLKRENEIRFSEEVQQLYTEANYQADGSGDRYGPFAIDRDVVIQLLFEFGFDPEKDDSFDAYRVSCGRYLEDPEVVDSVVWMKYGKKFRVCGSFSEGDVCPLDVNLVDLDGQPTRLGNFVSLKKDDDTETDHRPLVILAGSVS
eukprot:TRINITY_DN10750_c0_g1_i1.p1 TRINITY_DN10750_c0_g1~~TRINITY_DN10750_c0_g1_i1.p1  ORF type:complete len:261 (-),score=56.71 TRINITY_DN10750_c0_g1_i1:669-1451(-)